MTVPSVDTKKFIDLVFPPFFRLEVWILLRFFQAGYLHSSPSSPFPSITVPELLDVKI